MAKRGMNIYKRKDGRWEGRYKYGYNVCGKATYRSVYGKSYSAVKELLDKKRAEIQKSTVSYNKRTVGKLIDIWLNDLKNKIKESTYSNYRMKLKKHILPYFSGMRYDMLTPEKIDLFITDKLNSGLSEKYVADIVILLKSVAKFGQKCYGYANKIEYVTLPKSPRKFDAKFLSNSEQMRLKSSLLKNPDCSNVGILLAFVTGIRIGELCALKWSDVDFEKSIITVRRTVQRISNIDKSGTKLIISEPKSVTSVRDIPVPDFIIPLLKKNRSANSDYILSCSQKIIEPRTMQYRFKVLLKKAELPDINFHALRHMFATNCIAIGFDVKTLSEILGHSSVEITLNRYVHSSIERKRHCMKLISDNFTAA